MQRHVSFPSIEQFRHTVKAVRDRASYHKVALPVLNFVGSVKLHGTNAGVVQHCASGECWPQSRERLISVDQDNAGFARFVSDNGDTFTGLLETAAFVYGPHKLSGDQTYLAVYGEWCGQGIMSGVAINQVPKMFVIFGIAVCRFDPTVVDPNNDQEREWFTPQQVNDVLDGYFGCESTTDVVDFSNCKITYQDSPDVRIYSIFKFPTFHVSIDFARPEEAQNGLVAITQGVEAQCPVGEMLGVKGVGEGVVWKCYDDWTAGDHPIRVEDLVFKVKGEKHSDSKVKVLVEVDVEKVKTINEFADMTVTPHRCEKMVQKLSEAGVPIDVKSTGDFLKLVGQDVLKEEADRITASGLDRKDLMPAVSRAARQWWMKYLDELTFGKAA